MHASPDRADQGALAGSRGRVPSDKSPNDRPKKSPRRSAGPNLSAREKEMRTPGSPLYNPDLVRIRKRNSSKGQANENDFVEKMLRNLRNFYAQRAVKRRSTQAQLEVDVVSKAIFSQDMADSHLLRAGCRVLDNDIHRQFGRAMQLVSGHAPTYPDPKF